MEKKMRRARKKWLLPLTEMPVWQALNWIDNAGQRQLRAAVIAMESCSQTNCWWAEAHTAELLLPRARARLRPNT